MHNRKHQTSTSAAPENASDPSPAEATRPDPEVVAVAKRRTFSKSEKLRILAAADACVAPGEIGALLRQEGIYSGQRFEIDVLSQSDQRIPQFCAPILTLLLGKYTDPGFHHGDARWLGSMSGFYPPGVSSAEAFRGVVKVN